MSHPPIPEPPSYWHTSAPRAPRCDDLPASVDVAVIGGGLLGASTLYWLAKTGARAVLLERDALAAGASGRNGGLMVAGTSGSYPETIQRFGHTTARAVWNLTLESRRLLRQVLAEEAIDCDYRETGQLLMALGDEQLLAMQATVTALHADDFAADLLDRQGVQSFIGTPLGPEISGGICKRENGQLHSAKLVRGLAAAAQRHGALVCEGAEVRTIRPDGNGLLLETAQGNLRAGALVVAVNAWTSQLIPALADIITPVRGQVLAYAPIPRVFTTGVGVALTPTGEYWQQTLDGSIVLGGCRAVAPDGEVGIRACHPLPVVQQAIEEVFPRLFPELTGLQVAQRWAGPMAFTRDHMPIVDAVPDLPGAWFVGGFSGHGMPFGMYVGRALATTATSSTKPATLAPFALDRPTLC